MLTRTVLAFGLAWHVHQDDEGRFVMPDELRRLLTLGSALKPAWEPICLARKPLERGLTVAANVLKFGTGALNIDGCRVESEQWAVSGEQSGGTSVNAFGDGLQKSGRSGSHARGRWPANVLHDGSDEVIAAFPDAKGQQGFVGAKHGDRPSVNTYGDFGPRPNTPPRGDSGSAARFFWSPKASRADRNEGLQGMSQSVVSVWGGDEDDLSAGKKSTVPRANHHPTVKPTDLMRYLCRLVTPPGGTVLDPFMGSGSTLKAAELEGFSAIGMELSAEYVEIARRRIAGDAPMFSDVVVAA